MPATPPTKPSAPRPRILGVDDDADMLRLLSLRLNAAGYEITAVPSAEAALAQLETSRPQLVLSDVRLPGRDGLALFDEVRSRHPSLPVILLTAHGTIPDAVEATARGVFTYLTKPYDAKDLLDKIAQALALSAPATRTPQADSTWRAEIVSRSNRMADLLAEARMVAQSDASVLLLGDSGTGKELLARAIHRASPRAARPFVAVNCGAIPEALLESELFGHMKGAFTDAHSNHKGLFQAADGGTLMLDEIGDMPPALQAKLLRVLSESEITPLGARAPRAVSVRCISASHRPLAELVRRGSFREDLLYRLNAAELQLPALRQRSDLQAIADQMLATLGGHLHLGDAARAVLAAHAWPGNLRELHNALRYAAALCGEDGDGTIEPGHLPDALPAAHSAPPGTAPASPASGSAAQALEQLLEQCQGNVSEAARQLGVSRSTIHRRIQQLQLGVRHAHWRGP